MTFSVKLDLWKPHVRKAVIELEKQYPTCSWGTYPGHDPVESLAADAMVPGYKNEAGIALGTKLAHYVATVPMAKKLGIWYVIWRGRIWSMTRPEQGWLTYTPPAAAIKRNPDSAYHRNHVHISFYQEAEPKPEYLPEHVVAEGCWAAHQTKPSKWRDTGYVVSTLIKIDGEWGRTESGFIYPMKYLALKEN